MKLCECGCGEPTRIASKTDRAIGHVKGQPIRFICGHNGRIPIEERLWPQVEKTESCWLFKGPLNWLGYGEVYIGGKTKHVHRVVYELMVGPIPNGLSIDHLCRVRHCVNPAHLEPITTRENVLRGIGITAQNARKTHCKRGHEFTPENTYVFPSGGRACRTCRLMHSRLYERARVRDRRRLEEAVRG
jgi:hypothetical protein